MHNGIPLPASVAQPTEKTILWVGSLKGVKDPMTFLDACRNLIKNDREIRVIVAGAGALRPDIERYLQKNSLSGNFALLGEVPYEKIPFAKASIFVNSSIRESSSNSLLEALSFGIPVVATDNPGNRDVLSGLSYHRIVPVSDPSRMAEAIMELLAVDRMTRDRIAEESRRYVEDNYSIGKMVDGYIRMFSGR
ncbi:MAG TPA: glycosyltransferase [Candidatus Eisenbacteria bacterium]|uniref:Glycosyltransferase n=1 Tax=Eiseniibacteriota bacterium TaxID=2212470 RepID=A0A7V2AVK7_UNCEI|nr:glycosyltransferase [Candidatus Eisenbacteria bacterium]